MPNSKAWEVEQQKLLQDRSWGRPSGLASHGATPRANP